MSRRKVAACYDDDYYGDYDDYDDYGDYDEGDDSGDYDDMPLAPPKGAKGRVEASNLAKGLVGGPNPRPNGQPQRGAGPASQSRKKQTESIQSAMSASAAPGVGGFGFSTPSPDDEVRQAQQQGRRMQAAAAAAAAPRPSEPAGAAEVADPLAADLKRLQVQGRAAPAAKRRPPSEYRPDAAFARECEEALRQRQQPGARDRLNLVVLGHVDAGKSTLMGRLLAETGMVSQQTVHRSLKEAAGLGKQSFGWAFLLDERPEERARGVTVDVAMVQLRTRRWDVTVLDAPGHQDFVPNMISGAAQADAALLVVDGSVGGFEAGFGAVSAGGRGQTKEHAQLARSLGIEQLAVVVSKLDTCDFSQARFEEVKAQLAPFLKLCGFRDAAVQWLVAAAPQAINLVAPPPADEPQLAWFQGPTVLQAIDSFVPPSRQLDRPLRLCVADTFRKRSLGNVVVGGRVEAGALKQGCKVMVVPSYELATLKALEVGGAPVPLALAGDTADVGLAAADDDKQLARALAAGTVLCDPAFPPQLSSCVQARVVVIDTPVPILQGQPCEAHISTARVAGRVSALLALVDKATGEQKKQRPRCLLNGQSAVLELGLERAVCVELYSDCRALGRIMLRQAGRTLAVGVITAIPDT